MSRRNYQSLIKEYFSFTTGERNGIIVLMALIFISIGVRVYLSKPVKNQIIQNESSIVSNSSGMESSQVIEKPNPDKKHKSNIPLDQPKIKNVEINTCDSLDLERLPGLGKILSKRIIKYRNILGGFYSKDQLSEVFGLTRENLVKCYPYIKVDTIKVQKISINKATFKEINAHPYISFDQTKIICNMRRKLSQISLENLIQNQVFDSVQLKKVLVYIKFD